MGQLADKTRLILGAFNSGDFDALPDLVAENYIDHHVPELIPPGPQGVQAWFAALRAAFDAQIEVLDLVESADRVAARFRFAGNHIGEFNGIPATNRPFSAEFMSVDRYEGGKLVERWEVGDMLGLLQQIGVLPE